MGIQQTWHSARRCDSRRPASGAVVLLLQQEEGGGSERVDKNVLLLSP